MMRAARSWFRRERSLIALCVIMFSVSAVVTAFLIRWEGRRSNRSGYNFQTAENEPGSGPRIGERIAVGEFKTVGGTTLGDEIKSHPLTIAVLVDPDCSACVASKDQIFAVRDEVANTTIFYCVLMLSIDVPSIQQLEFATLLELQDHAYFASQSEKSNAALATMVIPSHLLLDANGTILQKWPGTNRDRRVRESMANQIVSDALNRLAMLR